MTANLIIHFVYGKIDENSLREKIGNKDKFDGIELTYGNEITKRLYYYDLDDKKLREAAWLLDSMPNVDFKVTNKFNWNFD